MNEAFFDFLITILLILQNGDLLRLCIIIIPEVHSHLMQNLMHILHDEVISLGVAKKIPYFAKIAF